MGMAASQARYLALVARKSNCEYEGQQINQARTVLSNQSANLFNQMLGLTVPVPPSTSDYTTLQYSFTDGYNNYILENWCQLATPEEEYNYIVDRVTDAKVYKGSQKKMKDPQVQYQNGIEASSDQIENALKLITQTQKEYTEAKAATTAKRAEAATLTNYRDIETYTKVKGWTYNADTNTYEVDNDGTITAFKGYQKLTPEQQTVAKNAVDKLIAEGALPKDVGVDYASVYMDPGGNIAFQSDLRNLHDDTTEKGNTCLCIYPTQDVKSVLKIAENYDTQISALSNNEFVCLQAYQAAQTSYNSLARPTYIGNCALTPLTELTSDQKAELTQIVKDMKAQDIDTSILNCITENGEYLGGIYAFTMNNITYYTTFEDLNKSYASGSGINNIDGQVNLSYYNATYVNEEQRETVKALLETDGNGRFSSVRFEDDTLKYSLNTETVTDDKAYQDAMNQYYYDNAIYDKTIQDINVKTSLIQQEDQQLELRLKQLDTEQNALSTEIDAVSKVVKDNVEKSFKTFGG